MTNDDIISTIITDAITGIDAGAGMLTDGSCNDDILPLLDGAMESLGKLLIAISNGTVADLAEYADRLI